MADPQQRDQDVVAYQSFSGVRNDVTPERFGITDLYSAVNIDIDMSGRLASRNGYTRKISADVHSLWASNEVCLYVSGNQMFRMAADYTSAVVRTLSGIGSRVSYERVNDHVFFSNGVDTGILDNGVARTWGIVPPTLPGASATVGLMPAGTYQFAMTYFRSDGQESGAPLAGVIELPAEGGINFTFPVSADPDIVSKGLYLSTTNGDELYLAALFSNATAVGAYTGDIMELSVPLETQFATQAPPGQLVSYYRGRMYVADGDVIYPSRAFAYEQFDLRDYIQLDGRVTMMAPMTDKESSDAGQHSGMFIGTDKSCGVLVGSSPESFQYVPKTNYGAILGAIDYVDGSLFGDGSAGARLIPMWLTTQGICAGLPDMEIRNLTRSKYEFTAAGQGAALFQSGPSRFIATSNY